MARFGKESKSKTLGLVQADRRVKFLIGDKKKRPTKPEDFVLCSLELLPHEIISIKMRPHDKLCLRIPIRTSSREKQLQNMFISRSEHGKIRRATKPKMAARIASASSATICIAVGSVTCSHQGKRFDHQGSLCKIMSQKPTWDLKLVFLPCTLS
ncbi:unnamed protein product [Clavelina lepadiformis]|uniref:Ribosomal protein S10 n=1 Tax=Clavelina lepadiformis TaxID=159417 RepID=A0ABP0G893_CLALP